VFKSGGVGEGGGVVGGVAVGVRRLRVALIIDRVGGDEVRQARVLVAGVQIGEAGVLVLGLPEPPAVGGQGERAGPVPAVGQVPVAGEGAGGGCDGDAGGALPVTEGPGQAGAGPWACTRIHLRGRWCSPTTKTCQALDHTQPSLPMKTGRAGTMTHDYKRHGTIHLKATADDIIKVRRGRNTLHQIKPQPDH
jgi:hypothetical protein